MQDETKTNNSFENGTLIFINLNLEYFLALNVSDFFS
jgi:hypothetical protein